METSGEVTNGSNKKLYIRLGLGFVAFLVIVGVIIGVIFGYKSLKKPPCVKNCDNKCNISDGCNGQCSCPSGQNCVSNNCEVANPTGTGSESGTPTKDASGTKHHGSGTPTKDASGTKHHGSGTPTKDASGTKHHGSGTPTKDASGTPTKDASGTPTKDASGTGTGTGTGIDPPKVVIKSNSGNVLTIDKPMSLVYGRGDNQNVTGCYTLDNKNNGDWTVLKKGNNCDVSTISLPPGIKAKAIAAGPHGWNDLCSWGWGVSGGDIPAGAQNQVLGTTSDGYPPCGFLFSEA